MVETGNNLKIQAPPAELERIPLVQNQRGPGWLSDTIAGVAESKTPFWWWCAFIPSFSLLLLLVAIVGAVVMAKKRI